MSGAATRRLVAEFLGSLLLSALVVGSGIAAQTLSPGDGGLQLMENALATALGLFVLIAVFQHVSGAHFNPVVSAADAALGYRPWRDVLAYVPAQILGCIAGAILANAMFDVGALNWSTTHRLTGPHLLAEVVATAGLVLVIFSLARSGKAHLAAPAVAAYIGAAYFFTSSTSFANPAITVGRMFSDTFAGIAPTSAPGYIGAQVIGGVLGVLVVRYLYPKRRPHEPLVEERADEQLEQLPTGSSLPGSTSTRRS
ncbi:MIP/aquaporin family protein [Naasia sp. SYSU D00948]|uniref:MIP/aquaporin family protein n=1 Tax=Naasia sp. SYSU D00948 TaxID=2817379 RepID=UPI001B30892E|nr:MIP/aquaporin family protein [Naasia sp. SYSU D00948]